jgi:hypothetical protein
MIITKLQGGLGNQLFQWAVSRSLSIKNNTEYYFDMSYFSSPNYSSVVKWNFELDKFNIKLNKPSNFLKLEHIIDNFHYKEINDNSYLDGYWQSEKYFIENEETIRLDLKIKNELMIYLYHKYSILLENTVSIHVRRGDYLNLSEFHPIQTIEYYEKAYSLINDKNINVVVLSNDIQWCKDNFKFDNITYIEGETNIVDMYIMSLCKHNIIANSSFSWWGAWLNNNKNKKVIAPVNWFGPKANIYTGDIIPKKWIII